MRRASLPHAQEPAQIEAGPPAGPPSACPSGRPLQPRYRSESSPSAERKSANAKPVTRLAAALENGDWIDGGLAAFSTVMDSIAMASDPLGQLFAMGFGWLLEHMQPLQGWLNQLTGDPAQVEGFAQSWSNINQWLSGLSDQLQAMVSRDLADMSGDTIDAYWSYQRDLAALIEAGGRWAAGMATAMGLAQTLVQIVHDIVRDAIAQVAGALCSYIVELVFSVGLATPLVIEQATTRAAEITTRISKSVTRLVDSGTKLAKHSDELAALFRKAKTSSMTPNHMPTAPEQICQVCRRRERRVEHRKLALLAAPGRGLMCRVRGQQP